MQYSISYQLRFVVLITLLLTVLSCEKQEAITTPTDEIDTFTLTDSNGNTAHYYLDGVPVLPQNFEEKYVLGQTVTHFTGKVTPNGPSEVEVHSFTKLEDYFQFSESVGGHARQYYAFDQAIERINREMDIENVYKTTGTIPESYHDKIQALLDELPSNMKPSSIGEKAIIRLYRDCSPRGTSGGAFQPGLQNMPFMGPLNNEVSMFGRFSPISLNFVYDRWFYNRRFNEVTGTSIFDGLNNVRFCPGERLFFINDRMSSGIFL